MPQPLKNLPDGWRTVSLASLGIFLKGAGITKEELSSQGHNAIRYGDLYGKYDFSIEKVDTYISDDIAKLATKIQYGDLLFAGSGETIDEIGKSAVYRLRDIGYAGGDVIIFRNKEDINSLFLSYFLNTGTARRRLRELGQGQSVVHIYKRDIANLEVILPSLEEQNRIVTVVNAWDQATKKLVKKINLKRDELAVLKNKLLSCKNRLDGFSSPWHLVKLGDLFKERKELGRGDLPLLSITSDRGVINQSESDKKDTSNADKSKYKRICPGDIGYNTMRMWQGRSALSKYDGIISPAYTVVTPKKDVDSLFFSYLFKTPRLIHSFYQNSQGIVSDTLNCKYKDFKLVKCLVPDYDEQIAISKVLMLAEVEIEILERKLDLFKLQKQFLLNNLVTGKIRASEHLTVHRI